MLDKETFLDDLAEKRGLESKSVREVIDGLGLSGSVQELQRMMTSERAGLIQRGTLVLGFRVGSTIIAA